VTKRRKARPARRATGTSGLPGSVDIEAADENKDVGLATIELYAFTSMDGPDLGNALPAVFCAMFSESRKAR
jgi:hypothetical protein